MMDNLRTEIRGIIFTKSSFSDYAKYCVGVAFDHGKVYVTNTALDNGPIVEFTEDEWRAFVRGVRNHEFDLA